MQLILQGLKSNTVLLEGYIPGAALAPLVESIFTLGLGIGQKLITQGYSEPPFVPSTLKHRRLLMGAGK